MFGPTAEQTRERVVPERDPAGAVHDGDTPVQRRDDFTPGILGIRAPEVGAVGPAGEAQRDGRDRQDAPRATGDRGDDRRGDGRSDEVAGTAPQRTCRPTAAARFPRHERDEQAVRRGRDETIGSDRCPNRRARPRPLERSGRPAERRVRDARGLGGHGDGDDAHEPSRPQQGRSRDGQSGGDGRGSGGEGHRLGPEKKQRGEREDEPQRHGRAVCRFDLPGSEDGGHDRRQREGGHPGDAARLLRPTGKPEPESACRPGGDEGVRQRARGNGDPGVAAMPGCVVTLLATQPELARTEPPSGWPSKLMKKNDFFYSGRDTAAGNGEKSVQECLSLDDFATRRWRRLR